MTNNDVSALDLQAQGSDVSGDVEQQKVEQQVTTEQAPVTDNTTPAQVSEETPDQIIENLYAMLEREQHKNRSNYGRVSKLNKDLEDALQEREALKARLEELTAPKIDLVALKQDYPDMAGAVEALSHQVDSLKKAQTVKPESVQIDDAEFQRRLKTLNDYHPDYGQISTDQNFWKFVGSSYGQEGIDKLKNSVDPDEVSIVLTEYKDAQKVQNHISTLRQKQLAATAPAKTQKADYQKIERLSDVDWSQLTDTESEEIHRRFMKGEIKK